MTSFAKPNAKLSELDHDIAEARAMVESMTSDPNFQWPEGLCNPNAAFPCQRCALQPPVVGIKINKAVLSLCGDCATKFALDVKAATQATGDEEAGIAIALDTMRADLQLMHSTPAGHA